MFPMADGLVTLIRQQFNKCIQHLTPKKLCTHTYAHWFVHKTYFFQRQIRRRCQIIFGACVVTQDHISAGHAFVAVARWLVNKTQGCEQRRGRIRRELKTNLYMCQNMRKISCKTTIYRRTCLALKQLMKGSAGDVSCYLRNKRCCLNFLPLLKKTNYAAAIVCNLDEQHTKCVYSI